jgi:hypothetical protein
VSGHGPGLVFTDLVDDAYAWLNTYSGRLQGPGGGSRAQLGFLDGPADTRANREKRSRDFRQILVEGVHGMVRDRGNLRFLHPAFQAFFAGRHPVLGQPTEDDDDLPHTN